MTIPTHLPGQSFAQHQQDMADWVGHGCVATLNAMQDDLHTALCKWLGIRSHSLAQRDGDEYHPEVAGLEECAVLHLQRLMACHGVEVPDGQ